MNHPIKKIFYLFIIFIYYPSLIGQNEINSIDKLNISDSLTLKEYIALGDESFKNYQYANTINYYKKVVDKLLITDTLPRITYYNKIGENYLNLGIHDEALKYMLASYKLSEESSNKEKTSYTLNNLGALKISLQNYEGALEDLFLALNTLETSNDLKLKSYILNNIGNVYDDLGDFTNAIKYSTESLQIKKQIDDPDLLIGGYNNLGYILFKAGRKDEALSNYMIGLSLNKDGSKKIEIGYLYSSLSELYIDNKNYTLSKEYALKSLEVSKEIKDNFLLIESYKLLAKISDELNQYKDALFYQKRVFELFAEDYTQTEQNQLIQITSLYETDKKQKENDILQKSNQLKEEKITNKNRLIRIFIITLLVLTGLFIILYINFKRSKKANQVLVQKNLEIVSILKNNNGVSLSIEKPFTTDNKIKDALTQHKKDSLANDLLVLFENEKIYLQKDLSIQDVAKELNSNQTYISKVINEDFNKNFNNFVNEYRVNEARNLLAESENWNLTIEAIANKVGFNSKSAFNTAFKKFLGITPSFFMNEIKSQTSIENL